MVGKRMCHVARYYTGNAMYFRNFFHSCRNIDSAPIDADRPLGITLLADDDLATMDPDPKVGDNPKSPLIIRLLVPDGAEDRVNRPQYLVSLERLAPHPQRNQAISFVEVDISAVVGDWFGHVEQEFTEEGLRP